MKLKLFPKIFLIVFVSVVVSSLYISFVSVSVFKSSFTQTIDDTVTAGKGCAETLLGEWADTVIAEGKMIATQRTLQAELEERRYDSLKSIIDLQAENKECDHLLVANLEGEIVAGDFSIGKSVANVKAFKSAARGQISQQWIENDVLPFMILGAVPVKRNGNIVGVILTGFDFSTEKNVEYFKEAVGCEFTIFNGNVRAATTLMENGRRLTGTKLNNMDIESTVLRNGQELDTEVKIAGTEYRCIYSPLKDSDGTVSGMLFVAKPQDIITKILKKVVFNVTGVLIAALIVIAIVSSMIVKRTIVAPIVAVKDNLFEIASGDADLTKRINLKAHDEIGDVVEGFNKFVEKLQEIVHSIRESNNTLEGHGQNAGMISIDTTNAISEIVTNIDDISGKIEEQSQSVSQTAGAVNQISSNIESLNRMIEGQASGIAQASSAVEEMIGNITSVNQSVEKMANSFDELNKNADIGFRKQKDVNERVLEIEKQSEMLEDANKAIADIAAETNLLAMNAAIEAAHAGDAGKGFSVVADEIRKLSETSTSQSKTIGEQLAKIRNSIENVVSASNDSSEALSIVADKIRSTDELVIQIKTAMEEQTIGSKQISEALRDMNNGSSEVRDASLEMTAGNKLILDEVRHLQNATFSMNESMSLISSNTNKISDTGSALNDVTDGLKKSISHIGGEINKFKV